MIGDTCGMDLCVVDAAASSAVLSMWSNRTNGASKTHYSHTTSSHLLAKGEGLKSQKFILLASNNYSLQRIDLFLSTRSPKKI
jgi:hypothetical protein